jgi:hypothetical protein
MKRNYIIAAIVIALLIAVVAVKSCKKLEIKQKSTDDKSTLSIEIKKEKPEDTK